MKYKPYDQSVKTPGEYYLVNHLNDSGFYKSHGESMQMHFSLQDRYTDLQQHSQELKD